MGRMQAHLAIMRLDHSVKNIFILPGIAVALSFQRASWNSLTIRHIALGMVAATLIACSNYVINEVLDAKHDKLHPTKCLRPAAQGLVSLPAAYVQWLVMMLAGLAIARLVGHNFLVAALALWVMGGLYNIPPIRTKDLVYLDVLTESVNNPLRMLLGWYMVTETLVPPVSLLCAYWMLGCYFMGLKRFSEYREIASFQVASAYRRSFRFYTEKSLLASVMFYASLAMLTFGVFIARYRIDLVLAFPFLALLMAMYFNLSFEVHSCVQHPEKLYKERTLMAVVLGTCALMTLLLYVPVPYLRQVFAPSTW